MRPGTKMLLITNMGNDGNPRGGDSGRGGNRSGGARNEMAYNAMRRDERSEMNYGRSEMDNGRTDMNYDDAEGRFRDRRGREHYDDGRYAPMNARSEYDEPSDNYYARPTGGWYPTTVPPVYERGGRPMNRIGFAAEGPVEFGQEYKSHAGYDQMNEMEYKRGDTMSGYGKAESVPPFSKEMAEEWTRGMKNEDGSKGPHWTMEQVKQVIAQKGVTHDPVEFWAVINAIYSDDVAVAKKHNVNTIDYYVDRAKAWLDDKDAIEDKAAAYYMYIVKK